MTMLNMPVRSVFSEITDFLATNPTPQEIIAYQLSEDLQVRAHELLERNGEDQLTPEERDEMFDFVRIDEMMSLLKSQDEAQAHERLSMTLPKAVQQLVRNRAGNCCEYCRLPAAAGAVPFHVDHINPVEHG